MPRSAVCSDYAAAYLIRPRSLTSPYCIAHVLALLCYVVSMPSYGISLFHKVPYHALIADKKAAEVGDLLTILIIETANAQTKSDISSDKNINASISAQWAQQSIDAGTNIKGDGHIHAQTGRMGTIKATVTVPIHMIFDNGFYYIKGTQQISINGETQTISLEGMVRKDDISAQNTVLSTRIANAHIVYTGFGDISNAHKHHYVYRFLSTIGLI